MGNKRDCSEYPAPWGGVVYSAVAKAVAAGAKLEKPVQTSKWGRLALLADPFGHGICLVEFIGAGYDEIAQP